MADGFSVELAAGPELAPFGMLADFDAKGRLFIAASSGKNIGGKAMSEKPECKILMLEDMNACLLYTSPSPRDATLSRMPSSA